MHMLPISICLCTVAHGWLQMVSYSLCKSRSLSMRLWQHTIFSKHMVGNNQYMLFRLLNDYLTTEDPLPESCTWVFSNSCASKILSHCVLLLDGHIGMHDANMSACFELSLTFTTKLDSILDLQGCKFLMQDASWDSVPSFSCSNLYRAHQVDNLHASSGLGLLAICRREGL